MSDPILFQGLTAEQAQATADVQRANGATAEIVAGQGGLFAVKVTLPEQAGGPTTNADQAQAGANADQTQAAANAADRAKAIVAACEAEWPQFSGDCSGFVRHVASRVGVTLTGLANEIVNEIRQGDWRRLANGKAAKDAADGGHLVIGGLRGDEQTNPDEHGHVVVVVSGPLDATHNAYPAAYWGRLGGVGAKNETVNFAWRAGDRDRVTYAAKSAQIG